MAMIRYAVTMLSLLCVIPALSQTMPDTLPHVHLRCGGLNEPGPLVIIDGIVYDSLRVASTPALQARRNPLELLNPNDIESIDVLKAQSAMDIYGVKARFGALIIKTKANPKTNPGKKISKKKPVVIHH